jgi:hypothetical protein
MNGPNENIFCAECGSRPNFRGNECACVPFFEARSYKAFEAVFGLRPW